MIVLIQLRLIEHLLTCQALFYVLGYIKVQNVQTVSALRSRRTIPPKSEILCSKYMTCMMRSDLKKELGSSGRSALLPLEHVGISSGGGERNER